MSDSPAVIIFDTNGNEVTVSDATAIPAGTRALISAGSDGTNSRYIKVDTSGNTTVVGTGVAGTPAGGVLTIQGVLGGTALPVSGTVTANIGTTNGLALDATLTGGTQRSRITDGTNNAAVKAASTAAAATDPALVVAVSPNNTLNVAVADVQATGNLNALNAVVMTSVAGRNSVGFRLAAGTLIGTIVPEASIDGGTTWTPTYFDQTTGVKVSSITFSSANTVLSSTIVGVGGSSNIRVRVSAFTSGTAAAVIRTSMITDPSLTHAGPVGSATPPTVIQSGGAVSSITPTYTTATVNPLSLTTAGALRVDGSNVTQPISAVSLPLPSGAATETTLSTRLADSTFTGRINTLGQKAMTGSTPVVIASDQTAIPVSGTITATNPSVGSTGATAPTSATLSGGNVTTAAPTYTTGQMNPLSLTTSGALRVDNSANTQPVSGTVAATQSGTWTVQPGNTANTTPWLATINQGGNSATVTASNALKVDGSAVTQPVSGTGNFTVVQATAANLNATVTGTVNIGNSPAVTVTSGTVTANIGTTNGLALDATLTGGTAKSVVRGGAKGTTTAADVTSSAVDANTQALHVAVTGTPAVTVSSGTVTANLGTIAGVATETTLSTRLADSTFTGRINTLGQKTMSASTPIVIASDQSAVPVSGTVSIGNTPAVTVSSGTVTANIGTTNGLALDATLTGGTAKSIVRGGSKGTTTAADITSTNVDANTQAMHVAVTGTPAVTISGTPAVTVSSGSITANLGTIAGVATETTLSTRLADSTFTGRINTLGQKTMANSTPIVIASDQSAIPITGSITANNASVGTVNATAPGSATFIGGAVTTAAPAYTNGQMSALSLTTTGQLRVDTSVTDTIVSGNLSIMGQTVQIALAGRTSAAGIIAGGSWSGSIVVEFSVDNTSTWISGRAYNKLTGSVVTMFVANATIEFSGLGGCTHVRLRAATMLGTANITLSATRTVTDDLYPYTTNDGDIVSPLRALSLGLPDTSGGFHHLRSTNTTPAGTEYAIITRNIPSGTQPVSGTVTVTQATGSNLNAAVTGTVNIGNTPAVTVSSGTVTANIGTTNGLSLDSTLTGGAQKTIVRGGAKGSTTAADVTSFAVDANTQALHVAVTGTPSVTISGTPSVTVSSGTVTANLGTIAGVATESTLSTRLADSTFTGRINTLGQKTMAASTPVVLASDQASIPVTGTITANNPSIGSTGATTPTSAQLSGGAVTTAVPSYTTGQMNALSLTTAGLLRVDGSNVTQPVSGTVTVAQATAANLNATVTGTVNIGNTPAVTVSSGTVTANIGTTNGLALDATLTGGTQKAIARGGAKGTTTAADITSLSVDANTQAMHVAVTGTPAVTISGTPAVTVSSGTITANLGTIAGVATETTLSSRLADSTFTTRINTLGQKAMTASTPVVIASDQSTLPVSGTVTANAGTGTFTVAGTVTSNIGTTNGLALDATLTGGTQKAIARGGAKGTTTAADITSANVDANTQAMHVAVTGTPAVTISGTPSVNISNTPAVTVSSGTVTVSGTVTSNIGTTNGLALDATLTGGTAKSILRSATKGTSTAADLTSANVDANTQALHVSVTGTPTVTVSGTTTVAGTVTANLGTIAGVATETTLATRLADSTFTGRINTLGQKTMSASTPVVISSDQSAIPITGSITANNASVGSTGATAPGSATLSGGNVTTAAPTYTTGQMNALSLTTSGALRVDSSSTTQPVSGTVTVAQATAANLNATVTGTVNIGNTPSVTISGTPSVTVSSGTVTANIGTTNGLALDATLTGGTAKSITRGGAKGTTTAADITSANVDANTQAMHVAVTGTPSVTISGTPSVTVSSGTVTANLGTIAGVATESTLSTRLADSTFTTRINTLGQKTMSASMPVVIASDQGTLPVSGTITANNPSIGSTGATTPTSAQLNGGAVTTAAPSYTTGQMNALSLTTAGALRVDASGTTQTVAGSGTFTVVQPTAANLNATVTGTVSIGNTPAVTISGTPAVTVSSGTITANIGTTNGLALDATLTGGSQKAIIRSGAKGTSTAADVTSSAVDANTQALHVAITGTPAVTISGTPTVTVSGTTTVSGTVTANIGTIAGIATEATQATLLADSTFTARINTLGQKAMSASTPVVISSDQSAIPVTGTITATNPSVSTTAATAPGSATYIAGNVTTAAPSYTTGQMNALSLTTAGALRTDGSGSTQPVSGTVTANQGTANTAANAWFVKSTDGTNTAAVKASGAVPATTDPALVVTLSPNSSVTPDVTATGNLNALNAAVSIAMAGRYSAGFRLTAGTLIGTIVAEASIDGGTTWTSTYFDQSNGTKASSLTFASANGTISSTIIGVGGASNIRIRVSAFTSGTAAIALRGSTVYDPSVTHGGTIGGPTPPTASQVGAAVSTSAPSYTTGTINAFSLTTAGALRVDNSGVTQPVSGSVSITGTPAVTISGTPAVTVSSGSVSVSGTVTANIGTIAGIATEATQATLLADSTFTGRINTLGQKTMANSTPVVLSSDQSSIPVTGSVSITGTPAVTVTSGTVTVANASIGNTGATTPTQAQLSGGAVTTAAPSYTTGQMNSLSLTTAGALRVDASGTTQTVSISGTPAVTVSSGTVTANLGTIAGVSTETTLSTRLADSTFTGRINTQGQKAMAASTPVVIASDQSAISVTGSVTASGTVTANQGTANTAANAWFIKNSDGTNTAAVKAASTAAAATDPALVVAVSPNNVVTTQTASNATAVLTNVAGSATSVTVLAANTARKGAAIFNDSTTDLFCKFGTTASATSFTVKILAGGYYEIPFWYNGIITGIWTTATGNARVTEIS